MGLAIDVSRYENPLCREYMIWPRTSASDVAEAVSCDVGRNRRLDLAANRCCDFRLCPVGSEDGIGALTF
jgi:hypothetical protein